MQKNYYVKGMQCAGCANSVEKILASIHGIMKVAVNIAESTATITFLGNETPLGKMNEALKNAGYELIEQVDETAKREEYWKLWQHTMGAILFTLPVFILGMFFMHLSWTNWIMLGCTIPVMCIYGREFFVNAWRQARIRHANMDTLVAVSTGVAFIYSLFNTLFPHFWLRFGMHPHVYYEASAVIITLVLVGRLLESRAKEGTASAIRKLIGMQPKEVIRIETSGIEEIVPIADVRVGDVLSVRSGEKIPVDGEVKEGNSYIDESMITGEAIAVEKTKGDKVYAGTLNGRGHLYIVARSVGADTILAQIISAVREAQQSKAPVQLLADKIAGIFVPIVMAISLITLIIWLLVGGWNILPQAIVAALSVLVISCPCALGLATPTAVMAGIGKGAQNNILIKDAESLELMRRINAIIFDKTGTLTTGITKVSDTIWYYPETEPILLALEMRSDHPLASSIVQYLTDKGITPIEIEDFESVTSYGVRGVLKGRQYIAGNLRMLDKYAIPITADVRREADTLIAKGSTVIYFASRLGVAALIAVTDTLRPEAAEVVASIRKQGISTYMLTGDNVTVARSVATATGIDTFRAEVLPKDKAEFVKALKNRGKCVAMIGDGINDSEALVEANVSIAMGRGSDIAIDVAQITLLTTDLRAILKAGIISRQTVAAIRQNLFWAFIYNVIGIPIAAGVLYPGYDFLLNPMIAAAAMAFSSISVVLNSLRIKMKRLK